ncbi:Hypothetical predicted protein, partial [Pelobates cultripes]
PHTRKRRIRPPYVKLVMTRCFLGKGSALRVLKQRQAMLNRTQMFSLTSVKQFQRVFDSLRGLRKDLDLLAQRNMLT